MDQMSEHQLDLDGSLHHGHKPHITRLINEQISKLVPYAGLILTVILVTLFLIRHYILEAFLLKRLYPDAWARMRHDERQRRGFVNHHVAGMIKIILVLVTTYPYVDVTFGKATPHTPMTKGSIVTYGDFLVVVSEIFISMYVFELLYRTQLSPVAVAHHVGAVVIAQTAVAISVDIDHEVDATIEFVLCLTWGAFDVIAEFWPHLAIILYRVYPSHHLFLSKVMRSACFTTAIGTLTETAVVMWLFGSLWSRWTLPFKVLTPILHVIFSAAQVWGSWNFYKMWQWQKKKAEEEESGRREEEGNGGMHFAGKKEEDGEGKRKSFVVSTKEVVAMEEEGEMVGRFSTALDEARELALRRRSVPTSPTNPTHVEHRIANMDDVAAV